MFTSFSTALSALKAQSTAVDVVGNNLANLNTPGFKESDMAFYDLVTQSLGAAGSATQVGFGVGSPKTIRQFTQGAIQTTSGPLDCAIQGDGFLVVEDNNGNTLYTRGGNLQVDKAGNLLTATGEHLQGWVTSNGVLQTSGPLGNIVVPVGDIRAPEASQNFNFDMNLAADGATGDTFSSSIEVYDSLGTSHVVTLDLTKSATANQWDYSISIPDADVTSPVTPTTGTLTFDSSGALTDPAADGTMPSLSITGLADGAADLTLNWQLWNGTKSRITQYAQPSATSAMSQDGYAAAQLTQVAMGDNGQILAKYSNGKQDVVGQLAMASIRNPTSLVAVGNNDYQLSSATALPAIGLPSTGGRGSILGSAIESSTVDIAKEFTKLIVFQRGYQANAKVITAVDELSTQTINLIR
jgi:flagellar hook protein FlgE